MSLSLTNPLADYFSLTDAAYEIGIHPFTVRRWIKSGKLDAVTVAGAYYVYKPTFFKFIGTYKPVTGRHAGGYV